MDTTHLKQNHTTSFTGAAQLSQAQVYAVESEKYGVVSALGCFWLPTALSCLLQPEVGDTVLISQADQEGYILAILKRTKTTKAIINLPNSTHIKAKHGLQIDSGSLFSIKTKLALLQAEQQKELLSHRFTQITRHDELRVNSQRLIIAKDWRVRTKSADIKAQQHLIIDGEKIHLG